MKKKIIIFAFLLISFNIYSFQVYVSTTQLRLLINSGIAYNFKISTDYNVQTESFFMDVPIAVGVDYRINDWFSLYGGIDITYGLHSYRQSMGDLFYTFYIHNLFLRIPVNFKFYPMAHKNPAYDNFYVSPGLFLHFWPMHIYYNVAKDSSISYGNMYAPSHSFMPPKNIYTPVNLGTKLSIGNHFYITNKILFGLELYWTFMFLPYINGYYFNNNYARGGNVILEFNSSVGISISLGIDLIGY